MTREELNTYGIKIAQSTGTGLVVLTYEIAIKYLEEALECHDKGNMADFRASLKKSKTFVNQLMSSLDMKYEISRELMQVYIFVNHMLITAGITMDTKDLDRVLAILHKLKASFEEVSKKDNAGPVMENTQPVYAGLAYSKSSLNESVYTGQNRGFTV